MKTSCRYSSRKARCNAFVTLRLQWTAMLCCALLALAAASVRGGGTFNATYNFPGTSGTGHNSTSSLLLLGSTLYGTTQDGGNPVYGTVFKVNTDGSGIVWMHRFADNATDGGFPTSGLVASPDGQWLYGTTSSGGPNNFGTLFAISVNDNGTDPAGTYTVLYNFGSGSADGVFPSGRLTISADGSTLYGVCGGKTGGGAYNGGTVFAMTITGESSTTAPTPTGYNFVSFPAAGPDSTPPWANTGGNTPSGDLTLSPDGNWFYGVTAVGGQYGYGTVFAVKKSQINSSGSIVSLYSLTGTAADEYSACPVAGLTLWNDTLYGTTASPNYSLVGLTLPPSQYGTVFAIDFLTDGSGNPLANSGTVAWAHSVPATTPNTSSLGDLCWEYLPTSTAPGTLLGTTTGDVYTDNSTDPGSVFEISTDGSHLANLLLPYNAGASTPYPAGISPQAGLTPGQPPVGPGHPSVYSYDFYGTTYVGGSAGDGGVFDLKCGAA